MKILYADDEDHIRELVEMALGFEPDLELVTCCDGRAAIKVLEAGAFKPDLVLLDVMMPGLDGPATIRAIKADPQMRHLPVIFFTAKGRPHEHAELIKLGAIGVIAKPFSPLTLADDIRALMKASQ